MIFQHYEVTDQKTKFFNIWQTLKTHNVAYVKSFALSPDAPNAYEELKKLLLGRYAISRDERIRNLDDQLEIGMPPDELYQLIIEAYDTEGSELIKKEKFVRFLPASIKIQLDPQLRHRSMEELLDWAKSSFSSIIKNGDRDTKQQLHTNSMLSNKQTEKAEHNKTQTDLRKLKDSIQQIQATLECIAERQACGRFQAGYLKNSGEFAICLPMDYYTSTFVMENLCIYVKNQLMI